MCALEEEAGKDRGIRKPELGMGRAGGWQAWGRLEAGWHRAGWMLARMWQYIAVLG